MTAPVWSELEALFHEAVAHPPTERAAFLAKRCVTGSDTAIQRAASGIQRVTTAATKASTSPSSSRATSYTRLDLNIPQCPGVEVAASEHSDIDITQGIRLHSSVLCVLPWSHK